MSNADIIFYILLGSFIGWGVGEFFGYITTCILDFIKDRYDA